MLSEEEANALERCRLIDSGESAESVRGLEAWQKWTEDKQLLACAMLRLYPPGWNDPVTPERLVELGGKLHTADDGNCVTFSEVEFFFNTSAVLHAVYVQNNDGGYSEDSYLPEKLQPRNMQEARHLLERCGATKEKTT